MSPDPHLDDEIDQLQCIMNELRDEAVPEGSQERRKYSLTKGDVILIYRIAKIAREQHVCPFKGDQDRIDTLIGVADNVTRTQKVASALIITATVTAVLSGIWFAIRHVFTEWIHNGGVIK